MSIDIPEISADVARALAEDIGSGDVTAALLPNNIVTAELMSREPMCVCGQAWVNEVFLQVDDSLEINWLVSEGAWLNSGRILCTVRGSARSILTAERTALNFLQTLSATATQTHHYVQKLQGTKTRLLDTRKTVPGLRQAQKYAVRCGGGMNHRMGLYDAFLIKENHIKACGSITKAIHLAKEMNPNLLIEVEVENLIELDEALNAGPNRIMLDNFDQSMLKKAVEMNQAKRCDFEVSGGVTLEHIAEIAQLGVDFISVGELTKSIKAIDLSLLVRDI